MKQQLIFFFSLILFTTVNNIVSSQTFDRKACVNNISEANRLYEKAQFAQAVALLEPCIKSGALKEHLVDAYRIVGLCYLQMNDEKKRDIAIFNLLKAKHDYQLFPYNDPVEFTNAMNQFSVDKSLIVGIKTGFNFTAPEITQAKSIKTATLEISGNAGQFIGLGVDYFLKGQKFSVSSWITSSKLIFSEKHIFSSEERLTYRQEENRIDFGVMLKYFPLKKGKLNPYMALGAGSLFFLNGLSNIVYTNDFTVTKTESSRDLKLTANKTLINGLLDIGATIKTGNAFLSIGGAFAYAFSNVLNSKARYDDIEFILSNQYVDSDVRLHHFNIYLNYSFPVLWRVVKSKKEQ